MPAFNPAPEFLTGLVDSIIIVLIVDWPSQTVAKHAFRERWKRSVRVLLEEPCRRGGIAFFGIYRVVDRRSELEELIFSYWAARSAESSNIKLGLVHMNICRGSRTLTSCHCP